MPAKGREMVFKVFLAVLGRGELSVVVSYLLVRNQLLSGARGRMVGQWMKSDLVLHIPCSHFYTERCSFQYCTFMIRSF